MLSVLAVFFASYLIASFSPRCAALALVVAAALRFSADELTALDEDFREAVKDIGFCTAALHMQIDASDLAKALRGEGHRAFDLRRIGLLPLPNQQKFYFLRTVRKGLPEFAKTAAAMTLAMTRREIA